MKSHEIGTKMKWKSNEIKSHDVNEWDAMQIHGMEWHEMTCNHMVSQDMKLHEHAMTRCDIKWNEMDDWMNDWMNAWSNHEINWN